jgi:inhibitor of KinA
MRITPLGDTALTIEIGDKIDEPTHHRVQAATQLLEAAGLPGVWEVVPAYTTVTLFYDPLKLSAAGASGDLAGWLGAKALDVLGKLPRSVSAKRGRVVEIPVCYGGEFGPDLAEVAQRTGLGEQEVVRRHTATEFLVYVIGFAPGFPYMGGLPKELTLPRRSSPRTKVPPGSVGIVNDQTCVYPLATPGGWNLIGRTPAKMFRPQENPPTFLRAGDRVKFRAITTEEFAKLEAKS